MDGAAWSPAGRPGEREARRGRCSCRGGGAVEGAGWGGGGAPWEPGNPAVQTLQGLQSLSEVPAHQREQLRLCDLTSLGRAW